MLFWNDDKEIVDTFVLKTIKRFDPANKELQELLPEYKDEEDKEFAVKLFRATILNADQYQRFMSGAPRATGTSRAWLIWTLAMDADSHCRDDELPEHSGLNADAPTEATLTWRNSTALREAVHISTECSTPSPATSSTQAKMMKVMPTR